MMKRMVKLLLLAISLSCFTTTWARDVLIMFETSWATPRVHVWYNPGDGDVTIMNANEEKANMERVSGNWYSKIVSVNDSYPGINIIFNNNGDWNTDKTETWYGTVESQLCFRQSGTTANKIDNCSGVPMPSEPVTPTTNTVTASGKKIYLKLGKETAVNWDVENAKFAAVFSNGSSSKCSPDYFTLVGTDNGMKVYEGDVPDGTWENVQFLRYNASLYNPDAGENYPVPYINSDLLDDGSKIWNLSKTVDYRTDENANLYVLDDAGASINTPANVNETVGNYNPNASKTLYLRFGHFTNEKGEQDSWNKDNAVIKVMFKIPGQKDAVARYARCYKGSDYSNTAQIIRGDFFKVGIPDGATQFVVYRMRWNESEVDYRTCLIDVDTIEDEYYLYLDSWGVSGTASCPDENGGTTGGFAPVQGKTIQTCVQFPNEQ